MFRKLVTHTEVHRQHVAREIHPRCTVKLGHQHRRLRDFITGDYAVEKFAASNAAGQGTEFAVDVPGSERFGDLKWNLKSRSVIGKTAANGRLRDVEDDSWKHRHVEAAFILVEKAPFD